MYVDLKRINAIAEHIGSSLSVFITDSGNGSSIGTADMVHMHARELVKNVLIEEYLGGSIRFISEDEYPIGVKSDGDNFETPKDDPDFDEVTSITENPANPDKWREWQEGEIPRNVHHLVRVSDSDTNFTCGHVYKVSELKMNDGYVAIKTSFGLDVMFSNKLAKSKFRPAI